MNLLANARLNINGESRILECFLLSVRKHTLKHIELYDRVLMKWAQVMMLLCVFANKQLII